MFTVIDHSQTFTGREEKETHYSIGMIVRLQKHQKAF